MTDHSGMRRVGILGGMGPQATILIMQKVLASVQAQDDADHIPLIVDQNPQVPSRIRHLLEGGTQDPGPVLADMARRLVAGGAQALALPCNTAHHYAGHIRAAVSVPFLDMIALSVAHARSLGAKDGRIGILASPAVRKVGLFDAAFAAAGLTAIYPQDEAALLAAIRQIKAEGPQPQARQSLRAASADLLAQGAAAQIIACTEFSLIATDIDPNSLAFDSLDLLVQAIKDFATLDVTTQQNAAQ
ncbi:MAG: aspartate/glutamate racemase family protein [Cypionkella sp.]